MQKRFLAFTMVEAIVVIGIAIAALIGAISLGASALSSYRSKEVAEAIYQISFGADEWFSAISTDIQPSELISIDDLCNNDPDNNQLKILNRQICASGNNGVGANPYGGDYDVSGVDGVSASATSAKWVIVATLIPDTAGGRIAKLLSQRRGMSANYDASTMTVTATYTLSTTGE